MTAVKDATPIYLGDLLDAADGAIVTLVAGETRLAAHRAVLAERSPVFAAMFQHDMLEASSGQVAIPDVEGPVLRQLLAYMYTMRVSHLPGMNPQLLAVADKYVVSSLKEECEQQMVAQLDVENAAATAVLAVRHSCSRLRKAALAFIKIRPFEVMATQGWADAMRNQPDDLNEVKRLLSDPLLGSSAPPAVGGSHPAGAPRQPHSDRGQTPATALPPAAGRRTAPPDADAVSRMRVFSGEERGRQLVQAAKLGAVKDLRVLLAAGAPVGARDGDFYRMTALHWAADGGHAEATRCLVGAGAELEARSSWQDTPLHLAAYHGRTAVVWLLLAASASPNARNQSGRTPLHRAAWCGHFDAAAALIEAGADTGAVDNNGHTALDLARQNHRRQLIEMLS